MEFAMAYERPVAIAVSIILDTTNVFLRVVCKPSRPQLVGTLRQMAAFQHERHHRQHRPNLHRDLRQYAQPSDNVDRGRARCRRYRVRGHVHQQLGVEEPAVTMPAVFAISSVVNTRWCYTAPIAAITAGVITSFLCVVSRRLRVMPCASGCHIASGRTFSSTDDAVHRFPHHPLRVSNFALL